MDLSLKGLLNLIFIFVNSIVTSCYSCKLKVYGGYVLKTLLNPAVIIILTTFGLIVITKPVRPHTIQVVRSVSQGFIHFAKLGVSMALTGASIVAVAYLGYLHCLAYSLLYRGLMSSLQFIVSKPGV